MQVDPVAQRVLQTTGSVSGFRPLEDLGSGYLSAETSRPQAFCGNSEGWGPTSPYRYDFTPCFLDVTLASVAAYGTIFGLGALLWLLNRKKKAQEVPRDWHFWTKIVVIVAIASTVVLQLIFQIANYPGVWIGDFRFLTNLFILISLGFISAVQWVEHPRQRCPNGVVLFYWLFLNIVLLIKLRSLISQQIYAKHLPYLVVYCVGTGLSILEFGLEWLIPKKQSAYDALGDEDECPFEFATVFSVLTFSWMTPLMKYGYKEYLTEDDLWNLSKRNTTKCTSEAFDKSWEYERKHKKTPNLWIAITKPFCGPYARAAVFKTVSDILNFTQPQLLRLLIIFVRSYETENPQPPIKGAAIALGMFAVSISQTLCLHQYFQRTLETGMRIKTALMAAIYKKALKLSNEGRASKSTGDIVNLQSVDTQRLQDLAQFGQQLWSAPLQIVLCMASLYQLVGVSFLAGIGVMIIMIPLNGVIARLMKKMQKEQMKHKDSRTRLITEIINNMKSIKLYAWGSAFMAKLNVIRNDLELRTLRKIGATQAFANFTWSTTPFLVSCSTFAVFVLTQGRPLTTDIVFPALTLFNLLTFPLSILPMVISAIIEASISIGRLTDFFLAEELQSDAVIALPAVEDIGDETIRIRDATFAWNRHENQNVLEDINFSANKGELSCVVGRVGAGKSSFLESILGDLWKRKGEVTVHGSVAYVAQQSWVMNASVRDNITFGHRWDPEFYEKTVHACALVDDFAQLPDGDETEVGERGISLSGGQKARLTLARAVYARSDIYLLDDCLSAVDQHVGRHLIENVLGRKGLLAGKTRVLATNSIPVLMEADFIILLRDQKIIERGSYSKLMAMKGEIANLIKSSSNQDHPDQPEDTDSSTSSSSSTLGKDLDRGETAQEKLESEEAGRNIGSFQSLRPGGAAKKQRTGSTVTLRRASSVSFQGRRAKLRDEEEPKSKQNKEHSEQGKVKWNVYAEYAKTSNMVAVIIYGAMIILAQTAQIGGNFWLKNWAEHNGGKGGNDDIAKYLGIYFAFGVGASLLVVCQTLILWIFCSIEASRKLHERMVFAIFRAPMAFFETTPAGRILNRFSSDIYRIDEVLARTFNMLFNNTAKCLSTVIVIGSSTPAFLLVVPPLGALYLYIQRYYLRASRELKRLDSVSKSPIFSHFNETLSGVTTIRGFRQQRRFSAENMWRVDNNLRAYFPSISANRWLAVRLEFIGSLIILSSAGFAIISVSRGSGLSAGLVGLAMSYALQITQSLNWVVRQTVEVETNIVSVERVLEYANLPSEAAEVIHRSRPPVSWPAQGAVTFNNYSTRYREGLDLVLKNINLDIKPREKIGVVGRTGAGKSSLTLALFRIIEACEGNINIDDLNTSTIGILDLRRRLAIIPQDAALFEGTIRDNLDPGNVHDDTDLWSVLEHARLKEHVATMTGGLSARINEGGSNLSQGQRQLVSLARALLAPSNILVLDEATSAVDVETDALIQDTIRSAAFAQRTIVTIAHRINTILDSDRIVVLEQGRVREFDTPEALIRRKGAFYQLVREAGLLEGVERA